uniref:Cnd3 domain-containing protein n=1 Tax=Bursaphelenchus xylophilus TaxID=6326 RepID=A0A1I7SGY9_BURXY
MQYKNADVRRLYADREDIDVEEARNLFLRDDILRAEDGKKLCVFIALHKLDRDVMYDLLGEMVVNRAMTQDHLSRIGRFLALLYDRASDDIILQGEDSQQAEDKLTKQWLATVFTEFVDFITICKDREIAEKFAAVFKSAVDDPKPDLSTMLFTATMRVWSRIDSPNDHIAWGAYYVQQCVYPPRSEDKIQQAVYEEKHQAAFISALKHPSVPIRLQALEGAVEKVVFWWDDFQKSYRSKFLDALCDLAKDSQAECRAAVFKCLRFFALNPATSSKAASDLLPRICKDGVDDVKEKVRYNCCKAMNFFVERANVTFSGFIGFDDLCHRLDFEENEAIEQCLVKLIKTKSPADYGLVLQKFVHKFVKISRNAALDYHRLLFCTGLIKLEDALKYIEALVGLINPFLEKKDEFTEEEEIESFNRKVNIKKDVFDCAIVLYATIQPTAAASDNSRVRTDLSTVNRIFSEIASTIFELFESHEGLMDSALTLASLSPNTVRFLPRFFLQVERDVRGGKIVDRKIHAFAMNDMNRFTQILLEGLTQVQLSSQKIASKNIPTPAKQSRPSIFLNEVAVIDALTAVLDNPATSSYLFNVSFEKKKI